MRKEDKRLANMLQSDFVQPKPFSMTSFGIDFGASRGPGLTAAESNYRIGFQGSSEAGLDGAWGNAPTISSNQRDQSSPTYAPGRSPDFRRHHPSQENAGEDTQATKLSKQEQFRRELDMQVALKNQRKAQEKIELQRQQEKERIDIANYNPFGKGGAGAPIRDANGALVTDLRQPRGLGSPSHQNDMYSSSQFSPDTKYTTNRAVQQQYPSYSSQPQYYASQAQGKFVDSTSNPMNSLNGALRSTYVPPLDFDSGGTNTDSNFSNYNYGINNNNPTPAQGTTESARMHSRFSFHRAAPEEQERIQEKLRKQQEAEQFLREQLEEKRRRKEQERREQEEEERKEDERLQREREELRMAFEREKGRYNASSKSNNQSTADEGIPRPPPMQEAYDPPANKSIRNKDRGGGLDGAGSTLRKTFEVESPQYDRRTQVEVNSPQISPSRSPLGQAQQNGRKGKWNQPAPKEFLPPSDSIRPYDFQASQSQQNQTQEQLQLQQQQLMQQMQPARRDYYGHSEVGHARLSVLREELLGEYDTLRRQLRKQEDALRDLCQEVSALKYQNEESNRKQAAAQQRRARQQQYKNQETTGSQQPSSHGQNMRQQQHTTSRQHQSHHRTPSRSSLGSLHTRSIFVQTRGEHEPSQQAVDTMLDASLLPNSSQVATQSARGSALRGGFGDTFDLGNLEMSSSSTSFLRYEDNTDELDRLLQDFIVH